MDKLPTISVVTVTYNCESTIEATIQSVIQQTYPKIEYIIIDGKSTDRTLEFVNRYKGKISQIISEKDNGIYDAMNKGIIHSTGEWIIFMNSGDSFFSENVVNNIFYGKDYSGISVLYGSFLLNTIGQYYVLKPFSIKDILKRMPFCHQTVFTRSNVARQNLFNTDFKIVADYFMFRTLYIKRHIFKELNEVVAIYSPDGGYSRERGLQREIEMAKIIYDNKFKVWCHIVYHIFRIRTLSLFPDSMVNYIRSIKYKIKFSKKQL